MEKLRNAVKKHRHEVPHLCSFISRQAVEFFDCDPMGVVWHGNYLKYMEKARGDFLRAIRFDYRSIGEHGVLFPVVETNTRYMKSLHLLDVFDVYIYVDEYEVELVHSFEIKHKGVLCAYGRSVQVCVDKNNGDLRFFMPVDFQNAVKEYIDRGKVENSMSIYAENQSIPEPPEIKG